VRPLLIFGLIISLIILACGIFEANVWWAGFFIGFGVLSTVDSGLLIVADVLQ
jgi:hypothetical protein